MRLYLFVIDGKPTARTELHMAQAVVEDRLLERREVSEIWWDDENPYIPRQYLYGASHSDYLEAEAAAVDADVSWEQQEQFIWPVDVGEESSDPLPPLEVTGVTLTMSVVMPDKRTKTELIRVVPQDEWDTWRSYKSSPTLPLHAFAVEAAQAIDETLDKKEGRP